MNLGILFWIIFIVYFLFGAWTEYTPGQPYPFNKFGGHFIECILIGILGYRVFPW